MMPFGSLSLSESFWLLLSSLGFFFFFSYRFYCRVASECQFCFQLVSTLDQCLGFPAIRNGGC
jgi:hypothetical protein